MSLLPQIVYAVPEETARVARADYAAQVGQDGAALLGWLDEPETEAKLRTLAWVQTLRQSWAEQFTTTAQGLRLRDVKAMPAVADLLASPMMWKRAGVPSATSSGWAIRCI